MRRYLPLLLLAATLVPWGVAVAQDGAPASDPTMPLTSIASASPMVAVALALAYGAYQFGQIVAKVTASVDALLEKGIPIRVELSDKDREALCGRAVGPRAVA